MRLGALLITAIALTGLAGGCADSAHSGSDGTPASPRRLTMTGSSTVAPLALEIARRYERQHSDVRIDVQSGGSSRGIADARSGVADIGLVSRALKADESDLTPFTIARDGVSVIVHGSNPVSQLSDEQIVAIYTGKVRNWQEVGGRDEPITVVNKAEGRSTLELFLAHFHLTSGEIRADVVIGENEQGIKTVAGNPGAIGYVSIGTAAYDAEHGVAIKLLPIGGVPASVENVRNGSFPLSRPLNLVTRGEPSELAREFLDFARSAEVVDLVQEQHFVPLVP